MAPEPPRPRGPRPREETPPKATVARARRRTMSNATSRSDQIRRTSAVIERCLKPFAIVVKQFPYLQAYGDGTTLPRAKTKHYRRGQFCSGSSKPVCDIGQSPDYRRCPATFLHTDGLSTADEKACDTSPQPNGTHQRARSQGVVTCGKTSQGIGLSQCA